MAQASFNADDSLLGSSTSLLSLPILYPPSASTLPFPARHHPRLTPPAIDPDLPPSDFDDTHSLLNSPNEHSRSILPGALADDDEGEQDSDAGLDDDEFRAKMDRDILGEEGEMSREEEKVARRARELGSRITARLDEVHLGDLRHLSGADEVLPHASDQLQPPSRKTLLRLLRSLEHDEWRYSPEALAAGRRAYADFVPYEWLARRPGGKAARKMRPDRDAGGERRAEAGGMDVDSAAMVRE